MAGGSFEYGQSKSRSKAEPGNLWGDTQYGALRRAFFPETLAQAGGIFPSQEAISGAASGQTIASLDALNAMESGTRERSMADLASRGIQGPAAADQMTKATQPIAAEKTRRIMEQPMTEYRLGREGLAGGADWLSKILGNYGQQSESSTDAFNVGAEVSCT